MTHDPDFACEQKMFHYRLRTLLILVAKGAQNKLALSKV